MKAPRMRLKKHIDFGRAVAGCKRCHGRGVVGYRSVEIEGETVRAAVVCRCVSRNGGVTPDKMDEILHKCEERLKNGNFGIMLARDILMLPDGPREMALNQLRVQHEDPDTDERVRTAVEAAINIIEEKGIVSDGTPISS